LKFTYIVHMVRIAYNMFKIKELVKMFFDNRKFIAFKIGASQKAVDYYFKNNNL